VRGPAAAAGPRRDLAHFRYDFRMPREAEIVVAAEVDEALAFNDHFRATVLDRERFDSPPLSPQVLAIDFGERRLER
jgi:hypothetical protein